MTGRTTPTTCSTAIGGPVGCRTNCPLLLKGWDPNRMSEPGCSPNLAAVATVTATSRTGTRRPATTSAETWSGIVPLDSRRWLRSGFR